MHKSAQKLENKEGKNMWQQERGVNSYLVNFIRIKN